MKIVDLDACVEEALTLFEQTAPARLSVSFKRPLVVGSGNAGVTGKVLFSDRDAVFADESTYEQALSHAKVDGAVLVSASGGKHAPIIAKELQKRGVKSVLLTNNEGAAAKAFVDRTIVSPKNPEPYSYNVSTYLGLMLSKTGEDSYAIKEHLREVVAPRMKSFRKYDAFLIIVPERFDALREMFLTKFDELFGPMVNGRVFTREQVKHAKTIVPSKKELVIGLGVENDLWGSERLDIPLPSGAREGGMLATGYWVIGRIQQDKPPYFKKHIGAYVKKVSEVFGEDIKTIVD